MSRIGMFPRGLGVRLGSRGLFASLLVVAFAVMLSSHFMTLGGVLVMFGRFAVCVFGHAIISLIELEPSLNAVAAPWFRSQTGSRAADDWA
jgi:hypothetical protein